MTAEQFDKVQRIFLDAIDCPVADRAHFIQRSCIDSTELLNEVESLLRYHDSRELLESSALGADFSAESILNGRPLEAIPGFDGYQLIRRIGQGAMGVVYEAQQENPPRRVAIKIMRDEIASATSLRRFQRETRALARMRHDGIAPIYSSGFLSGITGKRPYLAMELVQGTPLLTYSRSAQLDSDAQLRLFLQVCGAVSHAHEKGVIHRDLKPEHILVETHHRSPQIKVLDFGMACLVDDPGASVSHSGGPVGTIGYMSPEQAVGQNGRVDARSDVFSLGVILYELLAGETPFDKKSSWIDSLRNVSEQSPVRISKKNRSLRGDIDLIIARCLEMDPARRYQAVAELVNDIQRYLDQLPLTIRAPSFWYSLALFSRKHRNAVMLGAVLSILLIASLIGLLLAVGRLRASNDALETQHRASLLRAAGNVEEIVASLGPVAGSQTTQRLLLEGVQNEVTSLLRQDPSSVRGRELLAQIMLRLSVIDLVEAQVETAQNRREAALIINEQIHAERPDDDRIARQRALNLVLIGDLKNATDDPVGAFYLFEQALGEHRRLAKKNPQSADALDDLVWSFFRTSSLFMNSVWMAEAAQRNQEGTEVNDRLLVLEPYSSRALRGQWALTAQRQTLARFQECLGQEEEHIRALLPIAEQLRSLHATDRLAQMDVISTCLIIGEYEFNAGHKHTARRYLADGLDQSIRLLELEPFSEFGLSKMRIFDNLLSQCGP